MLGRRAGLRSRPARGRGAAAPARWAPGAACGARRPRVAVATGLRRLEARQRQTPGLPRGTGPGTGRHGGVGPAGRPGLTRPDSRSLGRSPFGSGAPPTSRTPPARRQLDSDGASPTFVRQVRHFTSLSPPTRPRARPPGSACFLPETSCACAFHQPTPGRGGGQLAPARAPAARLRTNGSPPASSSRPRRGARPAQRACAQAAPGRQGSSGPGTQDARREGVRALRLRAGAAPLLRVLASIPPLSLPVPLP